MKRFSDFQLEQFVLNELDSNTTIQIEQQLSTDSDLLSRINDIKRSNHQVLSQLPFDQFLQNNQLTHKKQENLAVFKNVIHKLSEFIKKPAFSAGFMATLSITFAVFLLPDQLNQSTITVSPSQHTAPTNAFANNGIRAKGLGASLKIYKKQGKHVDINDQLQQNDILQLAYIAGSDQFGYIFSIDGNGVLTEHFVDNKQAIKLNNNGEISLEFAYQLDDAPEFERFIFISSESEFSTKRIKQQAQQLIDTHQAKLAPLVIESDSQHYSINSITLNKKEGAK